jgi:hypothetical protein
MRARWIAAGVLVLVLGIAFAGARGSETGSKSGVKRSANRDLRWVVKRGSAPPGVHGNFVGMFHGRRQEFIPGDGFTVWNDLPGAGGAHEEIYCVIATQEPRRTFWCRRAFVLPRGQIIAAGEYDDAADGNNPGTISVVGGTGAYAGARGTLTSSGDGRRGLTLAIHLR